MATNNNWNNQITAAKSAITLNSGTNAVSISTDAAATTVNIGTGAAAKTVTVGSTNTTSALTLNSGSGGITATGVYGTAVSGLPVHINSSGVMGTSTLTTPVSFSAYRSATVANVTGDGTVYQCVFDTVVFNNDSAYNASTGLFTAPISGLYLFNATVGASNLGAGHTLGNFYFNATSANYFSDYMNYYAISSGGICIQSQTRLIFLNAGNTVNVRFNVFNSTKTVGLYGGAVYSSFSGYLIVPSIVPSQVSFAAYNNASPANVTGDGTAYTVAFDLTQFNNGSGFNTGTYTFTAPNTGIYQFNVTVGCYTLGAGHTLGNVQLVTTGATYTSNYAAYGPIRASNNLYIASFSQIVSMAAGDTAYVVLTVSGSTKTVGLYGAISNTSFSGYQIA